MKSFAEKDILKNDDSGSDGQFDFLNDDTGESSIGQLAKELLPMKTTGIYCTLSTQDYIRSDTLRRNKEDDLNLIININTF